MPGARVPPEREEKQPAKRRATVLLVVVLFGAAALRIWGLWFGLPAMYAFDERLLVYPALGFGTGDLNPHHFDLAALPMYAFFLLFGAYYGVGRLIGLFASPHDFGVAFCADPTTVWLLARSLSAVCGVVAVYLVFRAGQRVTTPAGALLGAALLAVHPTHVHRSHLALGDAMMTAFIAGAICVMLGTPRAPGRWLRSWLAGVLVGLAAASKYLGAFAFVALFVWYAWPTDRLPLRERAAGLVMCSLGTLMGFFAGDPFLLLEGKVTSVLGRAGAATAVGAEHCVSFAGDALAAFGGRAGLGIAGAALAAIGCVVVARREGGRGAALGVLACAVLAWLVMQDHVYDRWLLPAVPGLCVGAGLGAELAWRELRRMPRWAVRAFGAVGLAAIIGPGLVQSVGDDIQLTASDTRTAAGKWIEQHIKPGAAILLVGGRELQPPIRESAACLERSRSRLHSDQHASYTHLSRYLSYEVEAARRIGSPTYEIRRVMISRAAPGAPAFDTVRARPRPPPPTVEVGLAPLNSYIAERVEYIVTNSDDEQTWGHPQYSGPFAFFTALARECRLLAEFEVGPRRSGPTVRIWATRNARHWTRSDPNGTTPEVTAAPPPEERKLCRAVTALLPAARSLGHRRAQKTPASLQLRSRQHRWLRLPSGSEAPYQPVLAA